MGERAAHAPGTFSWADLATSDPAGAKAFYGALFEWEFEDMPVPGGPAYTMVRLGGRAVCALYQRSDDQPPPYWLSYVTVEEADASARRAVELGGRVVAEPFDVMTVGRMAVIADPTGAVLALWQPRGSIGAELVNDVGAMCLNQLNTSDPSAAARFYEGLFGWRTEQVAAGDQEYWGIYNGERMNGGMMPLPAGAPMPPHWLVYFTSADLDRSVSQIREGGGDVMLGPVPVPGGRIAVAADPQGAVFALFEGRVDD